MVWRNSPKKAEAPDASPAGDSASTNTTSSNSGGSSPGRDQATNHTHAQSNHRHNVTTAHSNNGKPALVPIAGNPTKPPPLPRPRPPSLPSSSSEAQTHDSTSSDRGPPPPSRPSSSSSSSETPPSHSHTTNSGRGSTSLKQTDSPIPLVAGVIGGIAALVIVMTIVACLANRKRRMPGDSLQCPIDSAPKGNDSPSSGGWKPPPPVSLSAGETSSGPHGPALPPPSPTLTLGFNKSTFSYEELAAATNGFAHENLLGQGGFGYVHKGVLPNGKEVAVKSLRSRSSGQGEREFHSEVDIISRVHHRHLVSLVGYCISGSRRLLVYDFVPNRTLEHHLHAKELPTMDWPTRLKIAVGSAKGLAYLHEDCHPRIIHRDIKSANILIDFKFEAMVADFGLAKLSSDNNTHVSTRVMGTIGYLAPEYASSGKLTEKSDVFSYGVMLVELITGRRPSDSSHSYVEDSLVDWARPVLSQALTDGNYDGLADSNLKGNYVPGEMTRMVASASAAVRHSARRRPKMSQIVRALEGDLALEELNEGIKPGQSMLFGSGSY